MLSQNGRVDSSEQAEKMDLPAAHRNRTVITLDSTGATGFSLYLRFPHKLNANRNQAIADVKQLNAKIANVRIPRQKSANYCVVDFRTQAHCDKAKRQLKKVKIQDTSLIVKPTTTPKQLEEKVKKTSNQRDVKSSLLRLIENIKRSLNRNYNRSKTNSVFIKDIPRSVKESDVKAHFPDAIEFRYVTPKQPNRLAVAFITLPTTRDASRATKEKIMLGGKRFSVSYQKDPPEPKVEQDQKQQHQQAGSSKHLQIKTESEIKTEDEIKEEIDIKTEKEDAYDTIATENVAVKEEKRDERKSKKRGKYKKNSPRYYAPDGVEIKQESDNDESDTEMKVYD